MHEVTILQLSGASLHCMFSVFLPTPSFHAEGWQEILGLSAFDKSINKPQRGSNAEKKKKEKGFFNYEGRLVPLHSLFTGILWTGRRFPWAPIHLRLWLYDDLTRPYGFFYMVGMVFYDHQRPWPAVETVLSRLFHFLPGDPKASSLIYVLWVFEQRFYIVGV